MDRRVNTLSASYRRGLAILTGLVFLLISTIFFLRWPERRDDRDAGQVADAGRAHSEVVRTGATPLQRPGALGDPEGLRHRAALGESVAACEWALLNFQCSRLQESAASIERFAGSSSSSKSNERARHVDDLLQKLDERREACRMVGLASPREIYDNYERAARLGSRRAQLVYVSGQLMLGPMESHELAQVSDAYARDVERLALEWTGQGNMEVALALADAYANRRGSGFLGSVVSPNLPAANSIYATLLEQAVESKDVGVSAVVLGERLSALQGKNGKEGAHRIDVDLTAIRRGKRVVDSAAVAGPLSGGDLSCR